MLSDVGLVVAGLGRRRRGRVRGSRGVVVNGSGHPGPAAGTEVRRARRGLPADPTPCRTGTLHRAKGRGRPGWATQSWTSGAHGPSRTGWSPRKAGPRFVPMGSGEGMTTEGYPRDQRGGAQASRRAGGDTQETDALFDVIGIEPGTATIDVGCGVMGVLHVLAGRVGPAGRVVGLDREPAMVQAAHRPSRTSEDCRSKSSRADATATGLPDAAFDVVHARSVLLEREHAENGSSPRWSGSRDPAGSWSSRSPTRRRGTAIRRTRRSTSCTPRSAMRIAGPAGTSTSAGAPGACCGRLASRTSTSGPRCRVTRQGDYFQGFLLTIASLVRDTIVAGGELTASDFDAHCDALSAHLDTPGTVTLQPVMWQAWGRRPLAAVGPDEAARSRARACCSARMVGAKSRASL